MGGIDTHVGLDPVISLVGTLNVCSRGQQVNDWMHLAMVSNFTKQEDMNMSCLFFYI